MVRRRTPARRDAREGGAAPRHASTTHRQGLADARRRRLLDAKIASLRHLASAPGSRLSGFHTDGPLAFRVGVTPGVDAVVDPEGISVEAGSCASSLGLLGLDSDVSTNAPTTRSRLVAITESSHLTAHGTVVPAPTDFLRYVLVETQ